MRDLPGFCPTTELTRWQTGSADVAGVKLVCKLSRSCRVNLTCRALFVLMLSVDPARPSFFLIPLGLPAVSFSMSHFMCIHFHIAHPLQFNHYISLFAPLFHCNQIFSPQPSVRPVPVSEGVTTTKELEGCCGAGSMNGIDIIH